MNRHLLLAMIQRHEGLRLKPYDCKTGRTLIAKVGKVTIGFGRNLQDNGISREEAQVMLLNDVDAAIRGARELWPALDSYSEPRQHALVDMVFNMGPATVAQFRKMREAIVKEDWEKAALEAMDSDWAKQVPSRAMELSRMLKDG